jgi:phosphatidylglycerol:prolipoprotein diacylglycerol transferase
MIPYPSIDPVIFSIGPVAVRWYGMMYVVAFAAAWWLGRRRALQPGSPWKPIDVDDMVFYGAIGVILGGRLGWILFYGLEDILKEPMRALRVWEGGMSFHGGLVGALIAEALLAWRRGKRIADIFDFLAPLPGLGILAVRIANFINGELWGKPTTVPWAFVVDPTKVHERQAQEAISMCERFHIDPCVLHVHASQLYEGLLEGLLNFVILWYFTSRPHPRLAPSGLFLLCYGIARFVIEFVRVPDWNRGYLLFDWVTMGQILSTPMILAGIVLLAIAYRRNQPSGNLTTASA